MLALAWNATISFSTAPIRLACRIGASAVFAGVIYFAYVLFQYCFIGDVVLGWPSLMCTMLILGGVQLTFIGLIGEYLARVFEESKRRPLYFFKQPFAGQAAGHGAVIVPSAAKAAIPLKAAPPHVALPSSLTT
jgi:hypothetical protein